MKIKDFDTNEKIFIIAEIGNNHEGNFSLAELLIKKAAESGADAVKFQTMRAESYISKRDEVRFKRIKSFEFSYDQFKRLSSLAEKLGIIFFSTPFDLESAIVLNEFVPCFKIASGDNNFFPLISTIALTGKPLIVSSGLSDLDSIKKVKNFIEFEWKSKNLQQELAVLHCVSSYPVPDDQASLNSIPFLKQELKCTVGYSDHTLGIDAAVAAAALGARIIEKHFTIDKNYSDFRDHQLSADPTEMKSLVNSVRRIERMLGKSEKLIQDCEIPSINASRRSIIAINGVKTSDTFTFENLSWVRPGGEGFSPGEESNIVGKKSIRDIGAGDFIKKEDLLF